MNQKLQMKLAAHAPTKALASALKDILTKYEQDPNNPEHVHMMQYACHMLLINLHVGGDMSRLKALEEGIDQMMITSQYFAKN